jgi:cytochrome P450
MSTARLTRIPGPAGRPVLGMVPAFRRDMLGTLLDGFHRYGDLVAYPLGPPWGSLRQVVVAVHHPDGVRQVLAGTGDVFDRGTTAFGVLVEAFGAGLLTADGEVWRRQRRTLQPLFTPRRVAAYARLMSEEAARVTAEATSGHREVVDLYPLMQRYTLRVVGRALFGADIDHVVADLSELVPLISDVAMGRALQVVRLPLAVPTARNRRFVRLRAAQYAIVDRILARRRSQPAAEDADDLVSRLFAARDPDTGQPLSQAEIRDQILVFMLAGHETTAGALTFTLHLLGHHPAIQDQVAGDDTGTAELVRAAVYEGMRLYPPAYVTQRRATADVDITGHLLPAGTTVTVSPWITHRHPAFWPEPDRFDPYRFIGRQDRPRYAYFPFGGGPRGCIGEHLALLEARILLQTLLARYQLASLDAQPALAPLVALRPARPVRARLAPR